MDFQILGSITDVEVIARGASVRSRMRLRKRYGAGAWRILKGQARVELLDGRQRSAEIHWYEAHGIGKKDFKIKRFLD